MPGRSWTADGVIAVHAATSGEPVADLLLHRIEEGEQSLDEEGMWRPSWVGAQVASWSSVVSWLDWPSCFEHRGRV